MPCSKHHSPNDNVRRLRECAKEVNKTKNGVMRTSKLRTPDIMQRISLARKSIYARRV